MTRYSRNWIIRVCAWLSQTANLFLLLGHHNMTISSRAYLNRHRPGWKQAHRLIDKLFFWQSEHCRNSYLEDKDMAQDILLIVDKKEY